MLKKVVSILAVILLIPCLAFAAAASTFTQSVQAKDAPKLVSNKSGSSTVYGELLDKDGKPTSQITDGGKIVITPLSQADSSDPDIKNSLKSAYNKIKDAVSLSSLINGLADAINKLDPDFSVKDLVGRDLFNITAKDSQITENNKLRVTFDLGISASDPVIIAMCNGDSWHTLDPKNVVNNGNGTVTVTFSEAGTVLVIVEGTPAAIVPGMSNGTDLSLTASVIGGCMIALVVCIVYFDRKRRNQKA
ncbi:MAG TPA: hypothetical protein PK854_10730 [Oscillospiraceae bacterium]|nr:hypothetical protein [Oscillospiraceae bacterium]HPS35725.1 hypothetical protein [Oscillospiraceae bacterium]